MQNIFYILLKLKNRIGHKVLVSLCTIFSKFILYANKFQVGKSLKSTGLPYISLAIGGKAFIGNNFKMHNSLSGNPIGRSHKCVLVVGPMGILTIGNNVGISFTSIVCHQKIDIKDNVMIGGGTCIYDSDFHPLNAEMRKMGHAGTVMAGITIEENVFIGTNSTILKGVTIGMNSIVGACSVVTKSIPPNEIWGGNPAKFLKGI